MPSPRSKIFYFLTANGLHREAERIAECGIPTLFFVNDETGHVQPTKKLCGSRWCPVCGKRWRDNLRERLTRIIRTNTGNPLRFITLTRKAYPDQSLEATAARMLMAWNALRRSEWWKANTEGAIAKIEINWNPHGKWWHYHLHLLVKTRWLSRTALMKRWTEITGDSWHVDVRPVNHDVPKEFIKYISKLKCNPSVPLRELVNFLNGKHLVKYYGCFRGMPSLNPAKQALPGYRLFGGYSTLITRLMNNEDMDAVNAIAKYLVNKRRDLIPKDGSTFDILWSHVTATAA